MNIISQQIGYLAYQQAHANDLEQSTLILMMLSGGIGFLDKALKLWKTDKVETGKYISKAKDVLLELMSSLNIEDSGEIGSILFNTYKRLFFKLTAAYLQDDINRIMEVRDSLAELEETWKQVFKSEEYELFKKDRENFKVSDYVQE